MTLADTSKARVNYQEALKADPGATEALRGLLLLQLQSDSASTILQTIAPLRGDSASASAVADALTSLLQSRVRSLNAAEASTALLYLAQSLPAARIGPPSFDVAFADRLRQVSASPSPIAEGVVALVNAYTVRATTYAPPPQSSWWQSSETYRAAWSSILRSLGDWYDQQNNPQVARSYYEASIGRGSWSLMESWIDKRALLPLALIYSRTDSGKDVEFQNKVAQLTEMLFYGKGAAYARGDLEEIRTFHTALGAIYASQNQWTGNGPRNAEFQLEHMREATQQLSRQSGRIPTDPAELLEKLAEHYQETGRAYQATSVKQQIKTDYARRGRSAAGDSVIRRIEAKK